jgi:hypothetical protein
VDSEGETVLQRKLDAVAIISIQFEVMSLLIDIHINQGLSDRERDPD